MADATMSFQVQATKGSFSQSFIASGITADMDVAGVMAIPATLGTSPVTLSTAALSALGIAFVQNLATDSTHVVTFGRWDGTTLWGSAALRGGEKAVFRMEPGNYAWKANVANVRALAQILEG
jgi:hypothetical protein